MAKPKKPTSVDDLTPDRRKVCHEVALQMMGVLYEAIALGKINKYEAAITAQVAADSIASVNEKWEKDGKSAWLGEIEKDN